MTEGAENGLEMLAALAPVLRELELAARDFVAKCDRGEARSVRSYAKFKAALGRLDAVDAKWRQGRTD